MNTATHSLHRPIASSRHHDGGWMPHILALSMHALLFAFLYGSIHLQSAEPESMEAELWSDLPTLAAPPPTVVTPPVIKPEPKIEPKVEPEPKVDNKPDIALEQEKKRKELEAKKQKEEEEKKRLAEEKQKALEAAKLAAKKEADHQKMVQSMLGQMGGTAEQTTGGKSGQGSGSSTASAGYAGRIASYIKRYIVFNNEDDSNPTTLVRINLAPDGTILSVKVLTPSGNKSYDDAVLRALDKAERLPLDNGKLWTPLELRFRLKDLS